MNRAIRGKLISLSYNADKKPIVSVEADSDCVAEFVSLLDKRVDVVISEHQKKRSNNANRYFHVLLNEFANAKASLGINSSDDELKRDIVVQYGVVSRCSDGTVRGFKLPAKDDPACYWKYTRCFDTREENGTLFNCYICYKRTRDMNVEEMCRVIDGLICEITDFNRELKDAGKPIIVTDTKEQLEKLKQEWRYYERENNHG